MQSQYSMHDVMEWLDNSQTMLFSVLSFVGEASEPLTDIELEHLRNTLVLAMDVVTHIIRNASNINLEGREHFLDLDDSFPLPDELVSRFNGISQTLIEINDSLVSRSGRLN